VWCKVSVVVEVAAVLTLVFAPSPQAEGEDAVPSSAVVINEIHYHPPNDADTREEFIELHNRSREPVDLAGWGLRDGVRFRFAADRGPTVLPARGYLLVARDRNGVANITPFRPDQIAGPYAGELSNRRDRVELVDSRGAVVDIVEYEEDGDWPARADGLGSSLQRISCGDSGAFAGNWTVSSGRWPPAAKKVIFATGEPVRWFENLDGRDPRIRDEFPWWHPDFDSTGAGWRDGRLAVGYDVQGRASQRWIHTDATARRGLHSILLRIEFRIDERDPVNNVPTLWMDWDDGFVAWLNGVEVARRGMRSQRGSTLTTNGEYLAVAVEASGDKRSVPGYTPVWSGTSESLRRGRNVLAIGNYNANDRSSDLFATAKLVLGPAGRFADFTPGAPNTVTARRSPPLASFVSRSPREARSTDKVTIRARVEGEAVGDVRLYYDTGRGEISTRMLPESGQPPTYTGQIPAARNLSVVRFRMTATNDEGSEARCPRAGNPVAQLGYYVVDDPVPESPELSAYHLLWSGRPNCSKGRWLEGCTFVDRGTAYLDVRVKYRGDTSCGLPKSGLRVAFNRGDLFRGQSRMNFNACWQDRSMLREVLAWDLYRSIGPAHCQARLAQVYSRGQRFHGLFVELEEPGSAYLRRNSLASSGALWKCRNSIADESTTSYEKLTNEEVEEHWTQLADFGRRLNALEGAALIDFLLEHVDIEAVIEYQTVKCLTSDEDGYEKNWMLFRGRPRSGGNGPGERWTPHAWDVDLSFGQINLDDETVYVDKHPLMGTRDHLRHDRDWNGFIEGVFGRRAGDYFVRALYGRIASALENEFHPEVLGPKIDRLDAATHDAGAHDLAKWRRWGQRRQNISFHRERLRQYTTARWRFLREFLRTENRTTLDDGRGEYRTFHYMPAPRIRICEIHYRPAEGDDGEFIELRNLERTNVDVSGWSIPAIGYTFPTSSHILAGSVVVIARSPARLSSTGRVKRGTPVLGPYSGRLADRGEDLRLRDSGRRGSRVDFPETIDVVKYRDEAPWPLVEDSGRSLTLRELSRNSRAIENWVLSERPGGSPGE